MDWYGRMCPMLSVVGRLMGSEVFLCEMFQRVNQPSTCRLNKVNIVTEFLLIFVVVRLCRELDNPTLPPNAG